MMVARDDVLQSLDSYLRPYVECLLAQEDRISMTDDLLQIMDLSSGQPYVGKMTNCNRFKLKIPYAQQFLTWEVMFDRNNMKEPPDFIFDAEDQYFHPPLGKINSFVCWDWRNRESLVALVSELLDHYKEYQLEKAERNTALQKHLSSLLAHNPDSLQLIVNKSERGLGTVNILTRIDVDFSRLPPYLLEEHPGVDCAVLHVCFPYPESQNIRSQLYLSPSVEMAFGGSGTLRIPVFQSGTVLGQYFKNVKQLLTKQVKVISDGFEKRKDFIAAFLSEFGKSVLEYDVETFSKITLLLEWNDFFFTFCVELPLYFPTDHPTFIFKSVYHNQNKKPYTEKYSDFPYSPRWSGIEMARRASIFILDQIKAFQMASVNHSDR